MSASGFPTTVADLQLNNSNQAASFYSSLKSLRKSTLSISNRLNSVVSDARFAKFVANTYRLPLVANERCGSWYIDPSDKRGSAYFKSTDGHHGQWDFSLRRLNLQLLPIVAQHSGAVIVDSTRRGKNLPDAFSKTVPIWVAVMNRALFPELKALHVLQTPPAPNSLGRSEIAQIETRLEGFVQSFINLGLDLSSLREQLKRPFRLSWAFNGQFDVDDVGTHRSGQEEHSAKDIDQSCFRLVLCSASRRVHGAEASEGGYIQGAGDDSEGWSHGLTAPLFWKHKDTLLETPEGGLEELITTLVKEEAKASGPASVLRITSDIYLARGRVLPSSEFDLIINCQGDSSGSGNSIDLNCRDGKIGSKDLREKLAEVMSAVKAQVKKDSQSRIIVTCSTGKDLSVGVVVTILCLLYDSNGQLHDDTRPPGIDKQLVKQRLAWITSVKPDANPSRATLQAVNSFLIERPH